MRTVLQITVLALALAVIASVGTFAPTHEVSANPPVTDEFTETTTIPPNPCNPEGGNLTGTYTLRVVVHHHPGEFLTFRETTHGTFTDANRLKYEYKLNINASYEDPPDFNLPQTYQDKVKFTSQTGVDNFEAQFVQTINEQGEVVAVHFNQGECRG